MAGENIRRSLDVLRAMGWTVQLRSQRRALPSHIDARYPSIPSAVRTFLEQLEQCARSDEQVYFLNAADYSTDAANSMVWNECEQLENTEQDENEAIRGFWDRHFPILLSVAGDYAYLAVCSDIESVDYGK